MNRLMQWFLTRRALRMMEEGWRICDGYGAQIMAFRYRPQAVHKGGRACMTGDWIDKSATAEQG